MFARFCFQKAGDTSLLHHCTPPKLNSMGHNCYLYQKDGSTFEFSLPCSEKSIYNLSSAPATSSLLSTTTKSAATKRRIQPNHVIWSLQNAHQSISMSVLLFLSQNPEPAKPCLCFSSLLKFHKKNPMFVVLFSFQKLRTTRTCLCFFPLLKINKTQLDVCGALFFPK